MPADPQIYMAIIAVIALGCIVAATLRRWFEKMPDVVQRQIANEDRLRFQREIEAQIESHLEQNAMAIREAQRALVLMKAIRSPSEDLQAYMEASNRFHDMLNLGYDSLIAIRQLRELVHEGHTKPSGQADGGPALVGNTGSTRT